MIGIRENLNRSDRQEVYDFLIYESHEIDKSHQLMKEPVFRLYFPDLYEVIISDERLDKYPVFKQKLWHFFNDDYTIHTCPICNGEIKFTSLKKGYQEHCSDKCRYDDDNYIEKVRRNTRNNWENMSDRQQVCENISKGKKESWSRYSDDERREMTRNMRDALEMANINRSDEERDEITRKRVESYKRTYRNKSDEEKRKDTDKRVKSYLETIDNRSDEDWERVSENIRTGMKNMSDEAKSRMEMNRHLTKLRNVQKTRPDVIEIYTPVNSKNTIYTCRCTNPDCDKCVDKIYRTTSSSYRYRKEQGIETCPILHPSNIGVSGGEKELLEYIRKIYKGEIIENDRVRLDGLEIDVYLPELKLGFEFQGDLWHANPLFYDENFVHPVNGKTYSEIHEKDEHKMKVAHERGITLIYVWENDWTENKRMTKKKILDMIKIKKSVG